MRCPCCKSDLIVTHRERYQSTDEHVSNPNGAPSLKDGYQCMDEFCVANNLKAVWTADGELYMDPPDGFKWGTAHEILKKFCDKGLYFALDSWSHDYHKMEKDKKDRTKSFSVRLLRLEKFTEIVLRFFLRSVDKLAARADRSDDSKFELGHSNIDKLPWTRKYKFEFVPVYKTDHGDKHTLYSPQKFRRRMSIWKYSDDHSCMILVPFYKQIHWKISKFNRESKHVISRNGRGWEDLIKTAEGLESYGQKTRISNMSGALIRIFYRNRVKKLYELKKLAPSMQDRAQEFADSMIKLLELTDPNFFE